MMLELFAIDGGPWKRQQAILDDGFHLGSYDKIGRCTVLHGGGSVRDSKSATKQL
jgi:hypothetical protein